jgi:hypothetical protein
LIIEQILIAEVRPLLREQPERRTFSHVVVFSSDSYGVYNPWKARVGCSPPSPV